MTLQSLLSILMLLTVESELFNDCFENTLSNWSSLWTREANAGSATLETQTAFKGDQSVKIVHHGEENWSFSPHDRIPVKPGDLFILHAAMKIEGEGSATLCVVTLDEKDNVLDWSYAAESRKGTSDWQSVFSHFITTDNVATIYPRVIGEGKATVWVDDFRLAKSGNIQTIRDQSMPKVASLENSFLLLDFHTDDGTISVKDKRTGQTWKQQCINPDCAITDIKKSERKIEVRQIQIESTHNITTTLELDEKKPEFLFTISKAGEIGELQWPIRYPYPFVSHAGTYLVVPMNEGISYPVDDPSISPRRLIAYGGHGICMPFWGVTDGKRGHMAILETPDDASIRIGRQDGNLCIGPEWEAQKRLFGYNRQIRYVFFDQGGHVAICKRYRQYAKEHGLLKTLQEKQQANPNVDKLIGAVNVWCWEREALGIVKEMKSAGIDRILWSNRESPEVIKAMNDMGILTSRYDIYQDTMNPDHFQYLRGVHPDWTTEAWPDDLMLDANGDWRRGWRVKGKDGEWYPCGVLCDKQALKYARQRIPKELNNHPYQCRFIDTTTASPWRECYHPDHPMTRSESKYWKMELLRYISEEMKLVTGSETGHDAAVPFVHYFEGMLSLGPYRVPDAGRNMRQRWEEVPERVEKFQVGHKYRLPLWELVYHDCVVAQWYWGDYNNKLPSLWDKRDLFNILYGTPPMFMFEKQYWENNRERFVQSYQNVCRVVRAVGYAEMTDHRFLTQDRDVQQTQFDNGVVVTVNFGNSPYRLNDQVNIQPMDFHVTGMQIR